MLEMIPFSDIMPVVVEPVKVAGKDAAIAEFGYHGAGGVFRWEEPAYKAAAISFRVWHAAECNLGDRCKFMF